MPKPRLRWFQYSLRSLLLAMLAASLGMSWVAVKMQKARRQKEAVEAILKFGGTVEYDYQQNTSGKRIRGALPPTATWWRNLLGNNFFDSVIEIQVKYCPMRPWNTSSSCPTSRRCDWDAVPR